MEEYKDTELTLDVFKTVLSYPQFKNYSAGIVIQAYLPDAWSFQTELLEFATKRFADGGAPLKMRLVKGANLQMESIVSSLKGWENPIFSTKVEVDANYLHILDRALLPENAKALHVGVASHNFFSIGYAYLLGQKNGVDEFITFEMLEGMANHLPRVMRQLGKQIILYTPVVKDEHFLNAISYLVRRLDENTGVDNFLSYSFNLKVDSKQWDFLQQQFIEAYSLKEKLDKTPRRKQNRLSFVETQDFRSLQEFHNESDTNFDLRPNRLWADGIRKEWMKSDRDEPYVIPVQMGDKEIITEKQYLYPDRSQEGEVCVCKASLSNLEMVKEIVAIAEKDTSSWRKTDLGQRKSYFTKRLTCFAKTGSSDRLHVGHYGQNLYGRRCRSFRSYRLLSLLPYQYDKICRTRNSKNHSERNCAGDSTLEFSAIHSCRRSSRSLDGWKHCYSETCHCGYACGLGICPMFLGCRGAERCFAGSLHRWS